MDIQIALTPGVFLLVLYLALMSCCTNLALQSSMDDTQDALNTCSFIAVLIGFGSLGFLSMLSAADYSVQTAPVITQAGTEAITTSNTLDYYAPWWLRAWLHTTTGFSVITLGLNLDGITARKNYGFKKRCAEILRLCRCNLLCLGFAVIMMVVVQSIIDYRTKAFFGLNTLSISLQIVNTDSLILWLAVSVLLPLCIFIIRRTKRLRRHRKQQRNFT